MKGKEMKKIIFQFQLAFTRRFGPRGAYGVKSIGKYDPEHDTLTVTARVKPTYKHKHGEACTYAVKMEPIKVWADNAKLYDFVLAKDK